jgi:hypothetical protein
MDEVKVGVVFTYYGITVPHYDMRVVGGNNEAGWKCVHHDGGGGARVLSTDEILSSVEVYGWVLSPEQVDGYENELELENIRIVTAPEERTQASDYDTFAVFDSLRFDSILKLGGAVEVIEALEEHINQLSREHIGGEQSEFFTIFAYHPEWVTWEDVVHFVATFQPNAIDVLIVSFEMPPTPEIEEAVSILCDTFDGTTVTSPFEPQDEEDDNDDND